MQSSSDMTTTHAAPASVNVEMAEWAACGYTQEVQQMWDQFIKMRFSLTVPVSPRRDVPTPGITIMLSQAQCASILRELGLKVCAIS